MVLGCEVLWSENFCTYVQNFSDQSTVNSILTNLCCRKRGVSVIVEHLVSIVITNECVYCDVKLKKLRLTLSCSYALTLQ